MGMYTELFVEGILNENAPAEVLKITRVLFDRNFDVDITDVPDHPFFKCSRWQMIGSCSSFYHIPFAMSKVYVPHTNQLCFISRSDLKNYDAEIEKFLDWLKPYCETLRDWHWYEEVNAPTIFNYDEWSSK